MLAEAHDSVRFVFDPPVVLPRDTVIDGFTADAMLSWLIAYAGPCGDPECKQDGIPGGHTRLYLIPVIGWHHVVFDKGFGVEEIRLRPAIMSQSGTVVDFMHTPDNFAFIAVLRATDDAADVARKLYKQRAGGDGGEIIIEHGEQPIQN